MKARKLHLLFCLGTAIALFMPPSLSAQQLGLRLYMVNDGLPGTSVGYVYQDKYGYLWIGSAGLSRFDGRQFVNYNLADGLPSLGTSTVFQDSKDRLWVGTDDGGVQFKTNRFVTYPGNDKLSNAYVFNFFETKDKNIWELTGNGIYEFADTVWKKVTLYPGYENNPCRNIIETDGELFINYGTEIICRNKQGKWLKIASHSFLNVMSVQDNKLWVSAGTNLCQIIDYHLVPLFDKRIVNQGYFSYLVDSKKRLWLACEIFLKKSEPGDWQHFSDTINHFGISSFIKEDSDHNIWTNTGKGLLKMKDIDFTIIDKNNNAPLDGIYNIITLPDNRVLFSSGKKTGLLLYQNNNCKQVLPPPSPGNKDYYHDPVDAYTFDKKNTLWMVTRFKRFLHFNGKTLEDFSRTFHFKTNERIYDMHYVNAREQFFICADSTLLFGSPTKLETFIPRNTGVPITRPTRLLGLKNGLLLVYTARQGVFCIDKFNNLIPLITDINGREKDIRLGIQFCEGAGDNFWLAIPGLGLYEYGLRQNKRAYLKAHISIADGLQSANILSLINDRQNRLWVATNNGIDIVQQNKAGTFEVFNYAKSEDLTISVGDFEKLGSDSKGNIWLSSPNKVIRFNIGDIRLHREPPHIIIEKISLDFKETDWSKLADSLYSYFQLPYKPVLNYSQNSLGIFFNAVDLSTSYSNPEYSYKLLPIETTWSIPSKTKSVSFAQLPSGTYKFIVRAKDYASGWSKPAVFMFTITPPFWALWWFRLIILSIAAFIIVSIFRARIRKIKTDASIENQLKELEMKALKAQMNPHFIYNALNSIQALVANDKKAEGIHYIGSFSRLLRQVLDNSENNTIGLDKELETLGLYIQLESLRLDMRLHYEKNIPENIVPEFEKIPPLILQPFVENALWHGLSRKEGEKEIKITVSLNTDWLICNITDNGIGREKASEWKSNSAAVHQSKGIDITKKRLIDFNEDDLVPPIEFIDLYDHNKKPAGTQVTVRIKRKFNYSSI
jgi:ligand-binding sensor domain-containing protein